MKFILRSDEILYRFSGIASSSIYFEPLSLIHLRFI